MLCLVAPGWAVCGEDQPVLWGYGLQDCETYARVWQERETGSAVAGAEYLRFQGWFAGFVSGLSLATGLDVLRGVDVAGAMRRISIHCEDHPEDDFFNASMSLIKILSKPSRKKGP